MKLTSCQASTPYLFFLITTNVELDGSIPESAINLTVNIASGTCQFPKFLQLFHIFCYR